MIELECCAHSVSVDYEYVCSVLNIFNLPRPRQSGHNLADDGFEFIFLTGNCCISIHISLELAPRGLIVNIPAWLR